MLGLVDHQLGEVGGAGEDGVDAPEEGDAIGAQGFVVHHHHDVVEEAVEGRGQLGDPLQARQVVPLFGGCGFPPESVTGLAGIGKLRRLVLFGDLGVRPLASRPRRGTRGDRWKFHF